MTADNWAYAAYFHGAVTALAPFLPAAWLLAVAFYTPRSRS